MVKLGKIHGRIFLIKGIFLIVMFDNIAHTYDFLNRILSFYQDLIWRDHVSKRLKNKQGILVDVATGTADQLIYGLKRFPNALYGVGIDISNQMLLRAKEKISKNKLNGKASLLTGDALKLPLKGSSADFVTVSFGVRNMDAEPALKEMHRILKPNGRIIILEFSIPINSFARHLHLLYLRNIIPVVGGLVSGNFEAYRYLSRSIEKFPYGEDFCELMANSGFKGIKFRELSFGVATIYEGRK